METDDLVHIRPWDDLLFLSRDRTVLATERDGFFDGGPGRGLFVHQTRLLSRYRPLVDGRPPKPVALSNVSQHRWLGYYVAFPPGEDPGERDRGSGHMEPVSEQTLELRVARTVGGGLREEISLANYSRQDTAFTFELDLDADFADVGETLAGERQQEGPVERQWREEERELAFEVRIERAGREGTAVLHRGLRVRVAEAGSPPAFRDGRIAFQVELAPHESWHARLDFLPALWDLDQSEPLPLDEYERRSRVFLEEAAVFAGPESGTLAPVVLATVERARRDLAALRLFDFDELDRAWTMAAGLPLYVSLFGRDTLTASWQGAMLGPEMMEGTLRTLARFQRRVDNDWRDEQPGRMLHEAHTGPLATLRLIPQGRYYGSITTSGFYPLVLAELWHWTGDRDLVRPLLGPALDALRWLERCSDRDGDGFFEYLTRSSQGVKHQAWKDSANAIVDADGEPVEPPIATCEEQAFVYVAKLHFSEVLWWMDEKDEAKRLFHEAGELKARFNETFWMEDEGFFALGLDPRDRPIRAIASNPGHCLAAGIVDASLVERTAGRLLADDLWTGWGIRTLSSLNPAYNPYSYHRGSVWPVEHGSFALGFLRYGLHGPLEQLCRGMFEAARLFDACRLPEAFSGHTRGPDTPFPALYPQSNAPQAWSASAALCMLQCLLGLYPYAPLRMLLVDPWLPDWLPEITVRNLRVRDAVATIRFFREGERSDYEVLDLRGTLHVLRQPSPWSLTASFAERLRDVLASLLPS